MSAIEAIKATRLLAGLLLAASSSTSLIAAGPAPAAVTSETLHGGILEVPLNKSQVFKADRSFTRALIGSADIADVLPLSNQSLHLLGKKVGSTTLTLYGPGNQLIQVVDVAVGPDVVSLRHQFADIMPNETIGAKISNDSIVLTGTVSSAPAADRAVQLASSYAGDNKVINMLSIGASQQVMLEVRFSEMKRSVAKNIGVNTAFRDRIGSVVGGTGSGAVNSAIGSSTGSSSSTNPSTVILSDPNGKPVVDLSGVLNTFGVGAFKTDMLGLNMLTAIDALEQKGLVKTLAEPTLIALSGETASFLAGGEFPIPVSQDNGGQGNSRGTITVEFKPFGISLAFTPTVLADGVINLVVTPEVSSIDPSASVAINGLIIPGLQTRRAKTTLELRDGQSFAIAGLMRKDFQDTIRQFPVLGSVPILGSLFRSTGFQKDETELVIVVTPRLVKPVKPDDIRLPTDRVGNPNELELFLMGRTDKAVGVNPLDPNARPPERSAPAKPEKPGKGGFTGPTGYEL